MDATLAKLERAFAADPNNQRIERRLLTLRRRAGTLDFEGTLRLAWFEAGGPLFSSPGSWKVFRRLFRRLERFQWLVELERREAARLERLNPEGKFIGRYRSRDGRASVLGRPGRWRLRIEGSGETRTVATLEEAQERILLSSS